MPCRFCLKRLTELAALLSAAWLIVLAAAWEESKDYPHGLTVPFNQTHYEVLFNGPALAVTWGPDTYSVASHPCGYYALMYEGLVSAPRSDLWSAVPRTGELDRLHGGFVTQAWIAIAPAALGLTAWLVLFTRFVWRNLRIPEGRCTHCRYDLRASTGRCPECGALIPETAGARLRPAHPSPS